MDRREFIAAAGTAAALASASKAFAQAAGGGEMEEPMHPPKYKALEETAAKCVATGNDCLRHCLGMYKMKDTNIPAIWPRRSRWSAGTARKHAKNTPRSPNAKPAASRVRPAPRNAIRLLLNQ